MSAKKSPPFLLPVYFFLQVDNKTTAWDVIVALISMLSKVQPDKDLTHYQLHEVVLGEQLERPIHHSEHILRRVALKWNAWPEKERKDNYLLFKR